MRVNGNTARLGEQADGEEDVIELDGVRVRTRQEPEKSTACSASRAAS